MSSESSTNVVSKSEQFEELLFYSDMMLIISLVICICFS